VIWYTTTTELWYLARYCDITATMIWLRTLYDDEIDMLLLLFSFMILRCEVAALVVSPSRSAKAFQSPAAPFP
jgi:hypothetical protein